MAAVATRYRAAPRLAQPLSVRDCAEMWGCHPNTARRRLEQLHRKTGRVLVRSSDAAGARMYTTLARIREADERYLDARELEDERLEQLEKKVDELRFELKQAKSRVRSLLLVLEEERRPHQTAPDRTGS